MPGTIRWMAVMLCLFSAPAALAIDGPAGQTPASALEFRVGDDFTISSFGGSTLSWKHLASETRGWRLGLSPTLGDSRTEDFASGLTREQSRELYGIEIEVQRLHFGSLQRGVRGYWGYGPQVLGRYDESRSRITEAGGTVTNDRSAIQRTWGVGASAVVGVEYFFRSGMSLMGEYGLSLWYRHTSNSLPDGERNDWSVGSRPVRLGLSVVY